ncbi:YcdB/YcdC domain-containing protein [Clostridium uliginosum]|uniref:S-layer homology domain-containing protein n=1 Tax=Clostridium uliginosum TaxID=119641 RepID=A0A1I1MIR6_9CLOT|nr:YcdB/YcdC domain-containing protein [Clostridium uliginosum]SFC85016.1 S-layer homology domain-containing protein [Clostridium uliginosum]
MKNKRFLSLILTFFLLILPAPVFAAETDSKSLEQAITAAKNIITVPDDYTNFTHSSSGSGTSSDKVTTWKLTWKKDQSDYGEIHALIDENKNLYEYNKYCINDISSGLAQITKEEAKNSAEKFLSKVFPSSSNQMKLIDTKTNNFQDNKYTFIYQQFSNDVPISFSSVNIGVNKYTGEVTTFNRLTQNVANKIFEYPTLDNKIDYATAKKAYLDKLGLDLKYYSYYDYSQKKLNIFPAYSVNNSNLQAIDAKTGAAIKLYNENNIYMANKMNLSEGMADKINTLTAEEENAIKNVSGLITKEKAESILKSHIDLIDSNMKLIDASLNKDYLNDEYIWQLTFEGGYGKVNAKSEELISFNYYSQEAKGDKNISQNEALDMAEQFLKQVAPDKFSSTKYNSAYELILNTDKSDNYKNDISSFNFVRQVNGIDFVSNSLNVEINKSTGKIIQYNRSWYDNVTFPSINGTINKENAFDKISSAVGFNLEYSLIDKDKVGLIYNFLNLDREYLLDPVNGTRLDFKGDVYKDYKVPEYTDISGHSCEQTVKQLLNNGYYIKSDKFNPDSNITQDNFLKYLYSPIQNYYNDEEFYNMLIKDGIIKEEEKTPNAFVSNQDASKFVIRYLKYEEIAKHSEIFINPFKDNIPEELKGYASICYGLNIIAGDNNRNFNASNNITNTEAASIIYNVLKQNKS